MELSSLPMIKTLFGNDKQQVITSWKKIADELGLTFASSKRSANLSLSGNWEGNPLSVTILKATRGGIAQYYTDFEVQHQHIFNTSFRLTSQGVVDNLFGIVGGQDILVGDADFDAAAVIKGWDETEVRAIFECEKVRYACLNLFTSARYSDVVISNEKAMVSVADLITDRYTINSILHHLHNAIRLLAEQGRKIDGDQEVVEEVKKIETPQEPIVLPSKKAPVKQVAKKKPKVASDPDPLSLPNVAKQLAASGDKVDVIEPFQGEEINWQCWLNHILPAGEDSVFGPDAGWIATCSATDFSPYEIQYRIGTDRKERFDQQGAAAVLISGKLMKFDSATRVFYIDSGDPPETVVSHSATVVISV